MLLGESEKPDLVDRAKVACREAQGDMPSQLGHPKAPPLYVHLLPTRCLDVGVRDVPCTQLALTCDLTLGHGGAEASGTILPVQRIFQEFIELSA